MVEIPHNDGIGKEDAEFDGLCRKVLDALGEKGYILLTNGINPFIIGTKCCEYMARKVASAFLAKGYYAYSNVHSRWGKWQYIVISKKRPECLGRGSSMLG